MTDVIAQNQAYFDEQRLSMIEFRITFGWNQPHGPSPEDHNGYYSTIWAPTNDIAAHIANVRYSHKWSMIYAPKDWIYWGYPMKGCRELEIIQYQANRFIAEYPYRDDRYPGCVYGCAL